MIEVKLTTKQAQSLESWVENHMFYCSYLLNGLENELPKDWEPYGVYCGCTTCDTREMLMATFDWLKTNGFVDVYVEDVK